MSDVSDEDATRMLTTCPQQVVHVALVNFGERHDTRAAHRKLNGEVARHARHPRSILARMSLVSGVSTRLSRGCYEETAPVKFKLLDAEVTPWFRRTFNSSAVKTNYYDIHSMSAT